MRKRGGGARLRTERREKANTLLSLLSPFLSPGPWWLGCVSGERTGRVQMQIGDTHARARATHTARDKSSQKEKRKNGERAGLPLALPALIFRFFRARHTPLIPPLTPPSSDDLCLALAPPLPQWM